MDELEWSVCSTASQTNTCTWLSQSNCCVGTNGLDSGLALPYASKRAGKKIQCVADRIVIADGNNTLRAGQWVRRATNAHSPTVTVKRPDPTSQEDSALLFSAFCSIAQASPILSAAPSSWAAHFGRILHHGSGSARLCFGGHARVRGQLAMEILRMVASVCYASPLWASRTLSSTGRKSGRQGYDTMVDMPR